MDDERLAGQAWSSPDDGTEWWPALQRRGALRGGTLAAMSEDDPPA